MKDPKPKKPLPTLYILGTKDPFMPVDGGDVKLPWGRHQNPPVAEMLAVWAKAIGCQPEPKTISDKDGVKKIEYPSKSGGPTLSVIYIEGHGHHWPGGERTLPRAWSARSRPSSTRPTRCGISSKRPPEPRQSERQCHPCEVWPAN